MIKSTRFFSWSIDGDSITLNTNGHVGLRNLGSTCYLSSFLQQFFAVTRFRQLVFDCESDDPFLVRLRTLCVEMQLTDLQSISPEDFVDEWVDSAGEPLDRGVQHDAAEFVVSFLGRLEALLGQNHLNELFQGQFITVTHTLEGELISESRDTFYILPVLIEGQIDLVQSLACFSEPKFVSGYRLGDRIVDVKRSTVIHSISPHLIVQLTRFRMNFGKGTREKIRDQFSFPLELELIGKRYCLRGVIIHQGSATSGHYYSYIFNENHWLCFNDDHVKTVNESDVMRDGINNGYLLFYRDFEFHEIDPVPPAELARKTARANADKNRQRVLCTTPFYQIMKNWASTHSRVHVELAIRYVFSVLPFCLPKLDSTCFKDLFIGWFRRAGVPLPLLGDVCHANTLIYCPTDHLRQTVNSIFAEALIISESADLFYEVADLLQECMSRPAHVSTFFEMIFVVLSRCQTLREFASICDFPLSLEQCITVHFPKYLKGKRRKEQTAAWKSLDLTHLLRTIIMFPLSPALRTFALAQDWIDNVLLSKTDLQAFALFWQAFGDQDLICAQLREFGDDDDEVIGQLIDLISAAPPIQ
jgi:hypothetical protein